MGDKTHMILATHLDSLAGMEHAIATGVDEGMKAWMAEVAAARS